MLALIGRILSFARAYRGRIYAAFALSFLGTILKSAPIGAAALLISKILDGTLNVTGCAIAALALLACLVAQALCQYGADRLQSSAGYELFAEKRLELAAHLRRLPMGYFTSGNIGKISSVLSADMVFIEENCMKVLADLMNDIFSQVVLTAFLFALDWQIGVACVVVELAVMCVGHKMKSVGERDSVARQEAIEAMNAQIIEHAEGFSVAKSNALLGNRAAALRNSFRHMSDTSIRFEEDFTPWIRVIYCIFAAGAALILGLSVVRYQAGSIELFAAIAVMLFVFSLFNPMRHLYGEGASLTIMKAAMDRFEALMAERELPNTGKAKISPQGETDAPEIEFRNVSFSYAHENQPEYSSCHPERSAAGASTRHPERSAAGAESKDLDASGSDSQRDSSVAALPQNDINVCHPERSAVRRGVEGSQREQQESPVSSTHLENQKLALSNVSFTIGANEVTALVGPSGSGKTTIANLLMRFWDVDAGSVLLRGTDVRELPLATVANEISAVFQRVYLFRGTIAENIRMGNASASDDEIREAARRARCLDFIERLPYGFNTKVGEGGTSLSGGEAQRISIARAILKDAPIVVLDEATASVDADNEEAIQGAINELCRGKTLIVIAHRLNTVTKANQILVLERGQIVERGTHEQLLAKGETGRYYRMFSAFAGDGVDDTHVSAHDASASARDARVGVHNACTNSHDKEAQT